MGTFQELSREFGRNPECEKKANMGKARGASECRVGKFPKAGIQQVVMTAERARWKLSGVLVIEGIW